MKIRELENVEVNRAVAYILGLVFPLYKEKNILGVDSILGCVNHNPGKITDSDLDEHLRSLRSLLDMYECTKGMRILDNKQYKVQSKLGFSIVIDKTNVSTNECLRILTQKVQEIKAASIDIQKEFIKGCFDGRSSWDTTAHYLAIDVDRDYPRQELIVSIVENTGINLNVNNRDKNHPKNDQLRIKPDCLGYFLSYIGMYSVFRDKQVSDGLGLTNKDAVDEKYNTEKSLLATFREFDTINVSALNERFGVSTTKSILSILLKKKEFVEFESGYYINVHKLSSVGVGQKDFDDYNRKVFELVQDITFFTARYLLKKQIDTSLGELGFGDTFFESVLKMDDRFHYDVIGDTVVFSSKNIEISLNNFIVQYLIENGHASVDEIIIDFLEIYGIELSRSMLLSRIKDTTIYHDEILDYLYKDYDAYYQDI